MMRVHGMKVIRLTTGDLTDVWKQICEIRLKKIYCEKSAEIIVLFISTEKGSSSHLGNSYIKEKSEINIRLTAK